MLREHPEHLSGISQKNSNGQTEFTFVFDEMDAYSQTIQDEYPEGFVQLFVPSNLLPERSFETRNELQTWLGTILPETTKFYRMNEVVF